MFRLNFLLVLFSVSMFSAVSAEACGNPYDKIYLSNPPFFAPDATRATGALLETDHGPGIAVPDRTAACLPVPLRYNNPGSIQTRKKMLWPNQIGKDQVGTAIFPTIQDGVVEFLMWMKPYNQKSAREIMAYYAPKDDCVGTQKNKDGSCAEGYNDTALYAQKLVQNLKFSVDQPLNLNGSTAEGAANLRSMFRAIMTYEVGTDFCHQSCDVSNEIFNKALKIVWP